MIAVFSSKLCEVKQLLERVRIIEKNQYGDAVIFLVELNKIRFVVVVTGTGKVDSGAGFAIAYEKYKFDLIIGLGCCAKTNGSLRDLVQIAISTSSVQYDVNFTALG